MLVERQEMCVAGGGCCGGGPNKPGGNEPKIRPAPPKTNSVACGLSTSVRLRIGTWRSREACIWNGICTEGTRERDWIGSCINSLDNTGQEDGGRGRPRGLSRCVRLGSISCPCQFREVVRAGKQVAVCSAVGSGAWDATWNMLLLQETQSPLSRKPRHSRIEESTCRGGVWNSPGEPCVTPRKTSMASKRQSCAMPRRFSRTTYSAQRV